jgi:hypothetical protein
MATGPTGDPSGTTASQWPLRDRDHLLRAISDASVTTTIHEDATEATEHPPAVLANDRTCVAGRALYETPISQVG